MSILPIVLLLCVVGAQANFPCLMTVDRAEVVNLDLAYWRAQDSVFINAHLHNQTDAQVNATVYELLAKYTSFHDFRFVAPGLGLDVVGPQQVVAAFNSVRLSNKGERHVSNAVEVHCTGLNNFWTMKDDFSLVQFSDGIRGFIGQKLMNISRAHLGAPFKIDRIDLLINVVFPVSDSVVPWAPQL